MNRANFRLSRECRVNLSSSAVDRYLKTLQNDESHSMEKSMQPAIEGDESVESDLIVSLDESVDDADKSVIFVEEKEATPKTKKIAQQNNEIEGLKVKIRSLKIHVKALESELCGTSEPQNVDAEVNLPNVNADDLNLSVDDQWVQNQIEEWRNNGELSVVCAEFQNFANNVNKDID